MKTRYRPPVPLLLVVLLCLVLSHAAWGQATVPFTIVNNSAVNGTGFTYQDSEIYVAVLGENLLTDAHEWVDPRTSQVLPMSASYNTLVGPVYRGDQGPGGNHLYGNCFARLSDIPGHTFNLAGLKGCRVYLAALQPLYFYFYSPTGGYSAPNPLSLSDPNQNILFETIELTNDAHGLFINTTRVDAYHYPMGLDVWGAGGYHGRTGELKMHTAILSDYQAYLATVPAAFAGTLTGGVILAPSKTPAFADGSASGIPVGPYANYLQPYIDAIWTKYASEDLVFNGGNLGIVRGRIDNTGRLVLTATTGGYAGRSGIVERRPTTQEALEGKGVLARALVDGDVDKAMQAQLTAAINRHLVNLSTPNVGYQDWHAVATFYAVDNASGQEPANYYARFWHLPGLSVDQLSYGFAYDDVAEQSATLKTTSPTQATITFGGFATAPLPVELVAFEAVARPAGVHLWWTTASERQAAYFAVERSPDGQRFTPVGQVAAQGNTATRHDYVFDDLAALPAGVQYYRLRQVDQDGTSACSPVRVVAVTGTDSGFAVYPTLRGPAETLRYVLTGEPARQAAGAELTVYALTGQQLGTQRLGTDATGRVELPPLPAGWYVVRLRLPDGPSHTARFGVR